MTTNIQVEYSWQPCLTVSHHNEVGLGTKPMIHISVVQHVVASGPVMHFWLRNEPQHILGHLSPVHKECLA